MTRPGVIGDRVTTPVPRAGAGIEAELARATGLLDVERTAPRWMTHRRSASEVFVCDSVALGPDRFAVSTQMPRAHALWSDRSASFHDPLMAVEAGRQATIMLAHAHAGLGRELMMVARSCEMRVRDREAFRNDGTTPLEGVFLMSLVDRQVHNGVPTGLSFDGDLFVGTTRAMSMTGTIIFTPRTDYELLRAHSRARKGVAAAAKSPAPAPIDPALVGRERRGNVAIGASREGAPATRPVVVDVHSPVFFDHPLDHVPGQLLMESCRQNAIVTAVRERRLPGPDCLVTAFRASFDDFAELDAGCDSRAHLPGAPGDETVRAQLGVWQLDAKVGDVEVELAAAPPHSG